MRNASSRIVRLIKTMRYKIITLTIAFIISSANIIATANNHLYATDYRHNNATKNTLTDADDGLYLANTENSSVAAGPDGDIYRINVMNHVSGINVSSIYKGGPLIVTECAPILPLISDKQVSGCSTLPDYILQISATNSCAGTNVIYRQSPIPGTAFPGSGVLTVTITADNSSGNDTKTFKVINTIYTGTPTVAVTALNNNICRGEQASFHATVTPGDVGSTYQWQINGLNTGTNSPDFVSSTLNTNDVVNCIVSIGGRCGLPNPGNGVTMTVNPKPVITLNPSEQIKAGTTITLNPSATGTVASYQWTPTTGLSNANLQHPVASPGVTTTYKLTVTSNQGCVNDALVTINVVHDITTIPNAFTPNGDGVNDVWNINYLKEYVNCTVNIVDRNGGQVFQSTGYATPWDGKYNGSPVPTAVYYYVIDLKDGSSNPIRSGSLTIFR
jgi:gliding motility-associated-like protein